MVTKVDQTFKAARADVKQVGTGTGSDKSGNHEVNLSWMVLLLTESVLF
jgi:hypothetical protein